MNNKEIKDEARKIRDEAKENNGGNELLQFFLGIILLGVGLFLLSKRVIVTSSWNYFRIGGFNMSSGLTTVPLIIGIIWYFFNNKSIAPKIIITLGVIIIIATIIMSISIYFVPTSMFEYIIIVGMAAAGAGLLLKTLFKNNK